jgi:hypothetical protein
VPEPSTNQIREASKYSQFRFRLIEFLKLPLDISESALREVLERTSPNVHRNYLARAERVDEVLNGRSIGIVAAERDSTDSLLYRQKGD